MQTGIPFYSSKTFWLNLIMAIIAFAGLLTAPDSAFHLGEKGLQFVGGITAALNLILRLFFTSKPIQGTHPNT